jgi:hypothetical protein
MVRLLVEGRWVEGGANRSRVDFVALAFCTSLDVLQDIFSQSWPPIIPFYEVNSAADTWVSVDWWVVVCFDNGAFVV